MGNYLLVTSEIADTAIGWHEGFDKEVWRGKPSFHNQHHIKAVLQANRLYFQTVRMGNDPLGLKKELGDWNSANEGVEFNIDELEKVMNIAFSCHDLGNITKDVEVVNSEKIKPVFLDTYRRKGAEERSIKVAERLIRLSDLDDKTKETYIKLVKHIIEKTKLTKRVPQGVFAKYVAIMDQIGGSVFGSGANTELGLVMEWEKEDSSVVIEDPSGAVNFVPRKVKALIPEKEKRAALFEIWDKDVPEKEGGHPAEPMKIGEYVDYLKSLSKND